MTETRYERPAHVPRGQEWSFIHKGRRYRSTQDFEVFIDYGDKP